MNPAVAGLVLAAGFSRRFGADKRRAQWFGGQSLLAASLQVPTAVLDNVWVVLRTDDDASALGVPAHCKVIRSPAAIDGMGHSLASGIACLSVESNAVAAAVFLGDMPRLNTECLHSLLAHSAANKITVPMYRGEAGHPVIFGRNFWPQLIELTGDRGGKSVLKANPHACLNVEVDDPNILFDVDTPQQLLNVTD